MSRRTERIASLIRNLVAEAMRDRLSDPRIQPLTSITRVDVSPDFSVARINVSVMAEDSQRRLCVEALQSAAGRLRSIVARQLPLRQAPALVFHLDDSLRRSFETLDVIEQINQESASEAVDTDSSETVDADSQEAADDGENDTVRDTDSPQEAP